MKDADPAAFRLAASRLAGGVVVVTTSTGQAVTVSAFASVSLDPPLVLFCADKIARGHDAIVTAGSWAVSVLAADAEKTARWLDQGLVSPLDGVPYHLGPRTGAPLLDGVLATLECVTDAVHDGGDHSIIMGRVVAAAASSAASARGPLVHYAGAYRRLRPLPARRPRALSAPRRRSGPGPSRGPRS